MMVTPIEAYDILVYLKHNNLMTSELKEKFQSTVTKYRLDGVIGNGRRSFIRRTYTCPFFNHHELGCPLPREVKPYGCLAFNSHHQELKAGEHCFPEKEVLAERENSNTSENNLNEKLKTEFKIYWEKLPLPVALLDIWDVRIDFGFN